VYDYIVGENNGVFIFMEVQNGISNRNRSLCSSSYRKVELLRKDEQESQVIN
jgi:hypothetical protein